MACSSSYASDIGLTSEIVMDDHEKREEAQSTREEVRMLWAIGKG
jgi:hypothetical protein